MLGVFAGKVSVASSEDMISKRMYRTHVVVELDHGTSDGVESLH